MTKKCMNSRRLFLIDLTINLTTRIISQLKNNNQCLDDRRNITSISQAQAPCMICFPSCIPDSAQRTIFIYTNLQHNVLHGVMMEIPGLNCITRSGGAAMLGTHHGAGVLQCLLKTFNSIIIVYKTHQPKFMVVNRYNLDIFFS
ncbi:hypothetical protein OIU84_013146 [Salix udensis]|uniref:Uncharacterized protein n=1 Tax=Salix udensis TaxID=889485 RepID=A0AAD6JHA9_9ROSI|nr:hypothetical protein OIU84_013146 [Salix udensis]